MSAAADWPQAAELSGRATGQPRVLIVRLSAVGDCVQTLPLASAIRAHWPEAHITWAVEKGSAPLVALSRAVDRLIVLPKRFSLAVGVVVRLRRELRRQPLDIALDPQGLTKSGLIAWLSGAPRRIGFARTAAREVNPWFQTELVASRAEHRVDRYLELLRPLASAKTAVDFGLSLPAAALAKADEFAAVEGLRDGYVVLNPGAGWDSKRWPAERYAELAACLGSCGQRSVVVWGGKQEFTLAEAIVKGAHGHAVLAPPTSLVELAAILQQAWLFVGSDTGPLHLAAAVGTRCVGLFGASSAAACGPYGTGHIVLQQALDDSPGRKRPGADNWAMRKITAGDVFEACRGVLGAVHANSPRLREVRAGLPAVAAAVTS